MADLHSNARIYKGKNGGGRFFVDYCNGHTSPNIKTLYFNSNAAALGAALMDSQKVQLFHEHVLVKEAATGVPTPWHQDALLLRRWRQTVSMWIRLMTCLEPRTGIHFWLA